MDLPVLIIGGGISGITAAVELAESGQRVVLVEREPYLGGNVSSFNNYFPKFCPPSCGLEINFRRIRSNPRIHFYTGAQVGDVQGRSGDFSISLVLAPRLINNRCTACGRCEEVCPETRDAPGIRSGRGKAAYMPGGLAFPMKYTIDENHCTKEACGKCVEVCNDRAIQLDAAPGEVNFRVRKIILATGWRPYDASRIPAYRYLEEKDVVINLEFERMLATSAAEQRKPARPSDGTIPRNIAFIQCAGSRDLNHLPYCSAVCCSASLKQALTLAQNHPEITSELFYIDLRLNGRNEKLLDLARGTDTIRLTKGKVGRITPTGEGGGAWLEVEDIEAGRKRRERFDMVVLATGLVPNQTTVMPSGEYGFYGTGQREGIIPAATCKRPMDVAASVRDATAAALKALQP